MTSVRIVAVEDNPPDLLLVEEALKAQGIEFSLERYTNGEEAAKAFAAMTEAPGLILVDLNIPRIHGLKLLRIIRGCPLLGCVPVAVLTSSEAAADRVRSEQCGANAYIVKPQGYYDFTAQVGAVLRTLLDRPTGKGTYPGARRLRHTGGTPQRNWLPRVSHRKVGGHRPAAGGRSLPGASG